MGGQAGGRGYLVQALISVLDAFTNDREWTAIELEPDMASDKVDILWHYPNRRRVVQVKSSQNQITVPDVKAWAQELEGSIAADEYEIALIGPVSQGVPGLGTHGKVKVPTPRPLDLDGLVHQAAHQLDRYLQDRELGVQSPSTREMVVNALVTRLSAFAATGTSVKREAFDGLLLSWIGNAAEVKILHRSAQTAQTAAFEPRPEEVELLTRLAASQTKALHLVKVDSWAGFVVLVDVQPLADTADTESCLRYIEAVRRLHEHNLIVNPRRDGEIFHLSSAGQDAARQLQTKCRGCGQSLVNVGTDPSQPPVWECRTSRCVKSVWHRDSKCPTCGKPPRERTNGGVGFTDFLCEDGHSFRTTPHRK